MYRLVLYFLMVLVIVAVVFSALGILAFKPLDLIFEVLILLVICWAANETFSRVFKVPANVESVYITALILALIITPPAASGAGYFSSLMFLFWAAVWGMSVKYILAFRGKHFFNPAAFAVALTALTINQSASWWVGTLSLLPLVILGGLLVTRKIQRFELVISFLLAAAVSIVAFSPSRSTPFVLIQQILMHSPIIFFAFIMLTEPLTTPPRKSARIIYGALVGLLFGPNIHIGSFYSTPEMALLAGNVFSYILSPKEKYMLSLKAIKEMGSDTYDFVFRANSRLSFKPGQYMEWTVGHKNPDSRGNRRYFTLASSPTEPDVHIGVKFYPEASSFKRTLIALKPESEVLAGQLSGDFTLPDDPKKKLVFLAGGIGITPFRSMIKYLLDRNEKRNIVLFYSNRNQDEASYREIFEQAEQRLGIKTVYIMTERDGHLTAKKITDEVGDYKERMFYISGSHGMVVAFEKNLKTLGIPGSQIKIDFFPGFA